MGKATTGRFSRLHSANVNTKEELIFNYVLTVQVRYFLKLNLGPCHLPAKCLNASKFPFSFGKRFIKGQPTEQPAHRFMLFGALFDFRAHIKGPLMAV